MKLLKFFANKRSNEEILKFLMVFGGVPRYLEEINFKSVFQSKHQHPLFFKKRPDG